MPQKKNHQHGLKSHHSENLKSELVLRLSKIEGQVRGVQKMITEDIYCDDILNQISSIQSSLNSVSRLLLENHMKSCVVDRIRNNEPEVVDELMFTFKKLMK